MPKAITVFVFICCIIFSISSFSQPAKSKPSKPVAKAAPSAKKTDYVKLKQEIRSLYQNEKYAAVLPKAAIYLAKFPSDTAVTLQKAASHVLLKQNKIGFDLIRNLISNSDSAAKYAAFMMYGVPEKDLQTTGMAFAEEAIKMSPGGPFGYFAKAGLLSDEGKHEAALPLMEKMYNYLRNDEEKNFLGQFFPKELAFNKQFDKALPLIETLYIKFKGDEEIINTYASILRMNKNYEKAIEKYDELLKTADIVDYKVKKAQTFFEWGKNTEACTVAEEIIGKDDSYEFLGFRYKCPVYFAAPSITDIKTAVWDVNFFGQNYDLKVTNPTGSTDTNFEFDWIMTSGPDMNGHIKITKEAMETATMQNNYFGAAMKDITLTDKTTIWVSKKVMTNILTNGSVKMDVGNGEEEFKTVLNTAGEKDEEAFNEKIMFKGVLKYINTLHIKNADGTRQLWILNDTKNPLIVKMQFDWSVNLKSIE